MLVETTLRIEPIKTETYCAAKSGLLCTTKLEQKQITSLNMMDQTTDAASQRSQGTVSVIRTGGCLNLDREPTHHPTFEKGKRTCQPFCGLTTMHAIVPRNQV